jgi:hypothetical protein
MLLWEYGTNVEKKIDTDNPVEMFFMKMSIEKALEVIPRNNDFVHWSPIKTIN